jgi:hypothetical protein
MGDLPTPPGPPGIVKRERSQLNSLTLALTPEELWDTVQSRRGFESSSSGAGDSYRSSAATVPPGSLRLDANDNPISRGAPLGKGYETFAGLQLVSEDGRREGLATGFFDSGGPENHAEAQAV